MYTPSKVTFNGKDWHPQCFVCAACGHPLPEDFCVLDGKFYHEDCVPRHRAAVGGPSLCHGCGLPAEFNVIAALGHDWHEECFVCSWCKKPFPDGQFMVGEDHNPLHPHCWDAQEKARKQALKTTPRRNNNPVPAVLRKPGSTFFDGAGVEPEQYNSFFPGEKRLSYAAQLPTEAGPYGACMSEDELRAEFDKFDKNGNGVLERDEWLDWYRSKDHFGMDPDENVQKLVTKFNLDTYETIDYPTFSMIMLYMTRQ
jgi:hypothetical protein